MNFPDQKKMMPEDTQQMLDALKAENEALRHTLKERQEQAAFFTIITENMLDMIVLTDIDGKIKFIGKSVEILGYEPDSLFGKNLMDFVHPEDLPHVKEAYQKLVASGNPHRIEYRCRCKDGSYLWIETRGAIIKEHNNIQGIVFNSRDITERSQAEDALKEQSRKLSERNKELSCLYGISRIVENKDNSLDDILQGTVNLLPDSWQYPEAACARIKFEDRVYVTGNFRETSLRQAQDIISEKEVVGCVEIFYQEEISPAHEGPFIKEERALIDAVAERLGHIIGRVRAQTRLRQSEQKFRDIFHGSNDAVFIHDISGQFLEVNQVACSRLGYSREEFLLMTPMDLDADKYEHNVPQRIQAIEQQGSLVFESVHQCKDGSIIAVEISSRKIAYEGRHCILSIARDITERKQAEKEKEKLQAQLNESQKMESVGRLAGGVAHDFNNMLSIINGYAEVSFDMLDPEEPVYENLKEIYSAGMRSANIVRQLLAFARQQTISPLRVDLNDAISSLLKMLQRLIGENIDLVWHPGKKLWQIEIDPSQLDQIMANLAVNARDAISDVGRLTIETKNVVFDEDYCRQYSCFVPGRYVMLTVSDSGCGMEREVKENLFEPFFTTKEVGKGTGLGLSTIYGIVKQNKGFINVYSEPGQGTTFRIYLPAREEPESDSSQDLKESAKQMPTGSETVLLVEDEPAILHMGRRILEKLGYTVLTAERPEEALRLAEEYDSKIHLLLTDVVMPGMNGRELSAKLSECRPGLKLMYMSGYTADVIAHHGVLDEGVHYIQKPFSTQDLAVKVREAIWQE